ncbi:hypothetical protein PIB30_069294 [Stylosanthes scabra]|uniref:Uncharacterized protein n=1 Tax=Stylosanthes scabra TaxID=79078 RepID=A0ABU6QNT6_9FABA|nr:hypothetical protein [Stylosanthes scabra]
MAANLTNGTSKSHIHVYKRLCLLIYVVLTEDEERTFVSEVSLLLSARFAAGQCVAACTRRDSNPQHLLKRTSELTIRPTQYPGRTYEEVVIDNCCMMLNIAEDVHGSAPDIAGMGHIPVAPFESP